MTGMGRGVRKFTFLLVWMLMGVNPVLAQTENKATTGGEAATEVTAPTIEEGGETETEIASHSVFTRALQGGWIVFSCLLILIILSVLSWAIFVSKWLYLTRMNKTNDQFIKSFWDSRSLNDLNSRLSEYPYSPAREVFRAGYAELVRGSQLRDQASSVDLAISAAMDNLHRALNKSKLFEKRRMEKFIAMLAICASSAPFIGLFGTVVGIIGAFDGIALNRGASIDAVSQGISEALIATAFGLAAAIPAVVGYNVFQGRVRSLMGLVEGFSADFLNIVERYLVTDRKGAAAGTGERI